jgi:hypothetical protein
MNELNRGIFSITDFTVARKAFVKIANNIFAKEAFVIERSSYIDSLVATTPYSEYLVWRRAEGKKYIEQLPPETTYDHKVYSYQERNDLLLDPNFVSSIIAGNKYKILVDGVSNVDDPQWSVWEASTENIPEDANDEDVVQTPTQSEIFNTWGRFNGNQYFINAGVIPPGNEALSWDFVNNRFETTVNSANMIGFVSPNALSNYKHTVTVGSTNGDDDVIGLVVAFAEVNGVPHSLIANRAVKGSNVSEAWSLVYYAGTTKTILVNGHNTILPEGGGWNALGEIQIEVVRASNRVTIRTSQKNGSLDDNTALEYEIPSNSPFYGPSRFGYCAYSQAASYFANVTLTGYGSSFLVNNPGLVFSPVKTYDIVVDTLEERDAIPNPTQGYKVLVNANSETHNFWTVWEYNSTAYELINYQNYRTVDFFNYVDWYAEGYSYLNPPAVTYNTIRDRDVSFVNNKDKFVKVLDDDNGKWLWCEHIDGAWIVVARQSGTIELSEKFYDEDLIKFEGDVDQFNQRDGSIELKYLIDTLRSEILTIEEQNTMFYDMLHYIHSSQDQVTWAFKTSFLNLIGYNEPLKAVPVQPIDNTQNLIDYITEVKPYRVKVREFSRIVSPDIDNAAVSVMDFDFPAYFDESTNSYRMLDMKNARDLTIIQTTEPWKTWYANYNKTGRDLAEYTPASWNPTRFIKIGLNFDRIDHLPVVFQESFIYNQSIPLNYDVTNKIVEVLADNEVVKNYTITSNTILFNGSYDANTVITVYVKENIAANAAADRVVRFYGGFEETNIEKLTGIKDDRIDGGSFTDEKDFTILDQDGDDTINEQDGFQMERNNPEELVAPSVSDTLSIDVFMSGGASMPVQGYHDILSNGTVHLVSYTENADVVVPFADGKRISPSLYSVDHGNKTVVISNTPADTITLRTFSELTAGANVQIEVFNYHANSTYVIGNNSQAPETLFVDVNGLRLNPDEYTVTGSSVVMTAVLSAGDEIQITYLTDPNAAGMATSLVNDENSVVLSLNGPTYTWISVDGVYQDAANPLDIPYPEEQDEAYLFVANAVANSADISSVWSHTPIHLSLDGSTAVFIRFRNDDTTFSFQNVNTGTITYESVANVTIHADSPASSVPHDFYQSITFAVGIPDTNYFVVGGSCVPTGYGSYSPWFILYEVDTVNQVPVRVGGIVYRINDLTGIGPSINCIHLDQDTGSFFVSATTGYSVSRLQLFKLPPIAQWNDQVYVPSATDDTVIANTTQWLNDSYTLVMAGRDDGKGVILPNYANGTMEMRYYYYISKNRVQFAHEEYVSADIANGGTSVTWSNICPHVKNNMFAYPNGWMGYVPFSTPGAECTVDTQFDTIFGSYMANTDLCFDGTVIDTSDNNFTVNVGYTELFTTKKLDADTYRLVMRKEMGGVHNSNIGFAIQADVVTYDTQAAEFTYMSNVAGPTLDTVSWFAGTSSDRYTYGKHGPTVFMDQAGDIFEAFGVNEYNKLHRVVIRIGDYIPPSTDEYIPNIVVTVFDAPLITPESYKLSLTRPAYDLFNPKETGDYDAGGVEEYSFDTGVVGAVENDIPILVAREDSFRLIDMTSSVATLSQPLYLNNSTIYLSVTGDLIPPRVIDVQALDGSITQQDRCGVIWINGERIEFDNITVNGGVTELSGLRRGTHNTSVGNERIFKVSAAGNGSNKSFTMMGVNSMDGLSVAVYEPLVYANGTLITSDGYTGFPVLSAKTFTVDYTVTTTSSGLTVNFKKAPNFGTTVYLIKKFEQSYYDTGTPVYDGLIFISDQNRV